MTKLTLLTASWNSAATIGDTLRSVRAQTYPDIEHIVIDGGSKDDTMAVVAREGPHLARAVSERDKGIYDAYNKGIGFASGEIIGFINSDDFYAHTGVAARVMELFDADPELEAVHADLVYVAQDDPAKVVRWWKSRPCTDKSLARGFIPAHPTVFLRRGVYDKAGLFDLDYRLAADYEFLLRIFHTHAVKALYVPEIWVRMRTGGATGAGFDGIKRQNVEIRRAQAKHGVDYPAWKFLIHKVIDRTAQRLRRSSVTLPPLGFDR
jgi:glycosyltransferase involved in cell wall biosynthesis